MKIQRGYKYLNRAGDLRSVKFHHNQVHVYDIAGRFVVTCSHNGRVSRANETSDDLIELYVPPVVSPTPVVAAPNYSVDIYNLERVDAAIARLQCERKLWLHYLKKQQSEQIKNLNLDAPHWAQWLSMDNDGVWSWWANEPMLDCSTKSFVATTSRRNAWQISQVAGIPFVAVEWSDSLREWPLS